MVRLVVLMELSEQRLVAPMAGLLYVTRTGFGRQVEAGLGGAVLPHAGLVPFH